MGIRYDAFKIEKFSRTPAGALKVEGVLSRAGVFAYGSPTGVVREYRPASVVTRADTIDTLHDVPVTLNHPSKMVDPNTWKAVAIGHISQPRADGDRIVATVVISEASAISGIESRKLKELSCGYHVELDDTPGRTDAGEAYDRSTTRMVMNHVALLPPGGGRQGPDVALRLDAADDQIEPSCTSPTATQLKTVPMKILIRLDGKTHEVEQGSDEHLTLLKRADERDTKIADLTKQNEQLTAKCDGLTKDLETARNDAKEAPAKAQAAIQARVALETNARKVLGAEAKFDGKTDREVREMVCKARDPKFDAKDRTDDYVAGLCDYHFAQPETSRSDAIAHVGTGAPVPGSGAGAGDDVKPVDKVRKDSAEAHKKPLAFTK